MGGGLLLRVDDAGHVVRSVGAEPNGIVGLTLEEESFSWHVSPTFSPKPGTPKGPVVTWGENEHATPDTPISVEELVAACEGRAELAAVWQIIEQTTANAVGVFTRRGDFDAIRAHVDLLEKTCDAIADRIGREGVTE